MAAGLYDELGVELMLVDRFQGAVDAGEQALALWRQAGDRLREGGTLCNAVLRAGRLCRGPDAVAAAEAAVAILEPLGPTVELARAYARLAFARMVTAEYQAAIELAGRAQAIAEPLGALDVLSDALNTEGCSIADHGRRLDRLDAPGAGDRARRRP